MDFRQNFRPYLWKTVQNIVIIILSVNVRADGRPDRTLRPSYQEECYVI